MRLLNIVRAKFIWLIIFYMFTSFSVTANHDNPRQGNNFGRYGVFSNIVFILTDDQDVNLGGMDVMEKTKKYIGQNGVEFTNMFVTTPLCCPSRSSILTGRYVHNHKTVNNSLSGGCSSQSWQNGPEKDTFLKLLKQQEYITFYAGKYLNQYGHKDVGGVEHVPPGWDHWNGLVGNSKYYNYSLSVNGVEEKHGDQATDYLTNVITDKAINFISEFNDNSKPFFMMLCPPAPHAPFTPEMKYKDKLANSTAPRTPSFNIAGGKTKHWLVRQPPNPLPDVVISEIDDAYRNRHRTLLSVDDMVESVYNTLAKKNLLSNTYLAFSSDNGYHLGQFSLPLDKRQPYEFDIKVPLLVSGPAIQPGRKITLPVLNLDLAPTFADIAGISPGTMDGLSLMPLLFNTAPTVWRTNFVVEHQGEGHPGPVEGCPKLQGGGVSNCEPDCICQDSYNNTYSCVKEMAPQVDSIYCKFADTENFQEFYNITFDPDQLDNKLIPPQLPIQFQNNAYVEKLALKLQSLERCKGKRCNF